VGLGRGECTDGSVGAFCVRPEHCQGGRCPTGGNSAGTCSSGATGQPCDGAADCLSGVCTGNETCQ
jgi:hypothetical protein